MLKLSITQGPMVNGENIGFAISTKHIKEIANFLCEWYETIPARIAHHIEVIKVVPDKGQHKYGRILTTVVLSGAFRRSDSDTSSPWKSSIGHCFYCYNPNDNLLEGEQRKEVEDVLNKELEHMIHQESEARRLEYEYFSSLVVPK